MLFSAEKLIKSTIFQIPPSIQPTSTTSRMDFKRLLLQQSVKTGPTKISAAEQLKMSRQQNQLQQSSQPVSHQQPSLIKVMSPRSAWRFQTPRTDVLSSTIVEDTAAEEKAMKLSPEISKIRANNLKQESFDESIKEKNIIDVNQLINNIASANDNVIKNVNSITETPKLNMLSGIRAPVLNVQNNAMLNSSNAQVQSTYSGKSPAQNASESRRKSNQLARAQFLASTPVSQQTRNAFLEKRFRARSESPQHAITQKVARSPSAPTLETAL